MYSENKVYLYVYEFAECYSALEKEILPHATTWVKFENIMLSEISHKRTNVV